MMDMRIVEIIEDSLLLAEPDEPALLSEFEAWFNSLSADEAFAFGTSATMRYLREHVAAPYALLVGQN
jgi:hypothetical protein